MLQKEREISKSPEVVTFGCRLNAYESGAIRKAAIQSGISNTFIINTCAVTEEAERQARQKIRRIRRENPDCQIIVTGCAAQINPDQFGSMVEVDKVLGNSEKLRPESFASNQERVQVAGFTDLADHLPEPKIKDGHSRAYVQVQNGCDHRCTFCIIPFGRGPSKSLTINDVILQTRSLINDGAEEIVLTGVDITSWKGTNEDSSLGNLVSELLFSVPSLKRLRLTSLDVSEIDDILLELIISNEKLLPHIHLSLQSGDNLILKRMKRRHSREEAEDFIKYVQLARPDVSFGADLITGFPTETEEAFQNTMNMVEACGISFLHVFPFSLREGTPAALMPQVPINTRRKRASRLRSLGQQMHKRLIDFKVGKNSYALIEKTEKNQSFGRCDDYCPVRIDSEIHPGEVVPVVFTGSDNGKLLANLNYE